jgi:hypothetical protein
MKLFKAIGLCLFLMVIFGVCSREVQACAKCAIPTFKDANVRANSIFVGKVISVRDAGESKIFTFSVSKTWKGSTKKSIKVAVNLNLRSQPIFEIGKNYLIFAEQGDDRKLYVYRCSRSTEIENAGDDLKLLGKGKKVKK